VKKITMIRNILTLVGGSTIIIAFVLFILGFRPLIPAGAVEPNWEALQIVSTISLTIATLCLTGYISYRQIKLAKETAAKELNAKKLELKISLYDKRYRIYECFNKYPFDEIETLARKGKKKVMNDQDFNGAEVINMMIFNGDYITGRKQLLGELQQLKKKNLNKEEQRKKAFINKQLFFENLEFCKSEIALIEQAEFCFDHT